MDIKETNLDNDLKKMDFLVWRVEREKERMHKQSTHRHLNSRARTRRNVE